MDLDKSKTLFDIVAEGNDVALQRLLLEGKEERNVATLAHGNTLLHEAAWKGFSRCVKILCNVYPKDLDETNNKEKLHKKKQQFINRTNFSGFTALHLAAQNGHNQSLRELLYAGCSTSIQNDYGDSALHTAIRYGHAGVVRILISAKADIDAFNHNNDTPLHISAAIGRRKLTKLLVEAGAMQFRNNQNETPKDIARRKNFTEIVEIIEKQSEKIDKKLIRESLRKSKSGDQECLTHSKQKYNNFVSPYGCHYYPNSRNFPHPKLQTLPKEPLQKGEIYYLDLAGNIRKGPIGVSRNCACNCGQKSKEAMLEHCKNIQKYVDKANDKLNKKILELTTKIEKTERKHHHQREKSRERDMDPLYPLLKIVGDKNKQIHLEKWLNKVHPDVNDSQSDMRSPQSSEIAIKEVPVDVHCVDAHSSREKPRETIKVSRSSSRRMPVYDENEQKRNDENELENDDSYTDISDNDNDEGEDDDASVSDSENPLYDESFIRKFQQQQQFAQQNYYQNESLTSQSINSNQNIEMEMEKIAKSLMSNDDDAIMIHSRNPDVIKDIHVSHSAKRSTKKIKSAITKSTSILTPADLYVNTFFNNSDEHHKNVYKNSQSDADEVDSCEIEQLVTRVQQTIVGSNYASSSSPHNPQDNQNYWNRVSRSRNPIPFDITDEIDNYAEENFYRNIPPQQLAVENDKNEQVQSSTISENNFILLDKLLKARKHLNQNYHQHLQTFNHNESIDKNGNSSNIPSSSLV
ncbi:hypothetical protein PVAND_011144 [Polypedilum vanderplanki]|uniref:Ankyrin repeat domain-containing protein 6 n=1 Tax=Polypedilum vanderplanki TaxID=319348 RepID=A0A9J6CIP6_POLVA|nr:hypothetical protein PVAND_011144 [Polypedilum vanderplanki]